MFKKQHPKLTEERIKLLNAVYSRLSLINAAAQIIYMTDYAKQKQFVYDASTDHRLQEYEGTVDAAATKTIATLAVSGDAVFTFKNTGIAPLIFCLSVSENINGTPVSIGGGATVSKTTVELNNAETGFLLVKNTDAANTGSYKVTIDE